MNSAWRAFDLGAPVHVGLEVAGFAGWWVSSGVGRVD